MFLIPDKIAEYLKSLPEKAKESKVVKKSLATATVAALISGGVLVYDNSLKNEACYFTITDATPETIFQKMIEKIEESEVEEAPMVKLGCEIQKVEVQNGVISTTQALQFSDDNCYEVTPENYDNIKLETFSKIQRQDELPVEEVYQVRKNFQDIWNRVLFKNCGLVEVDDSVIIE